MIDAIINSFIYMLSKSINSLPAGFRYIPNFITPSQKQKILEIIMSNPWCPHLRRQQQYYGIKYFQTKQLDPTLQPTTSLTHFPLSQLSFMVEKVKACLQIRQFMENEGSPNQVLVNKYLKRDGLGYHVEDREAFGEAIVGLSLGSQDFLKLVHEGQTGHNKLGEIRVKLEDRSVYVLEGEARHHWKHGIGKEIDGKPFKSEDFMRISLTFRDVIETRRKL